MTQMFKPSNNQATIMPANFSTISGIGSGSCSTTGPGSVTSLSPEMASTPVRAHAASTGINESIEESSTSKQQSGKLGHSKTTNKTFKAIKIEKGPTGFGIAISENRHNRLIVRGLNPNGVAYKDGRMQVGDEIVAVNNIKVSTMKYDDIMRLLQSTQEPVEFHIIRYEPLPGSSSSGGGGTQSAVQSTSAPASNATSGRASPLSSLIPITKTKSNSAESRKEETSADLTRSGQEGESNRQSIVKFATTLTSTSPVDKSPSSTSNLTDRSSILDPKTNQIKVGEETLIEIERGKLGLGLSIVGGSDTQLPFIFIHEIYENGAAYKDKRLAFGDQILKVNEMDLTNATHEQALNALRQPSEYVRLLIHRGFYPPSKLDNTSISTIGFDVKSSSSTNGINSAIITDEEKYLNVINVDLNKKFAKGLGFSIIGKRDGSGVFISHIVS
jgi:hypothetical protein